MNSFHIFVSFEDDPLSFFTKGRKYSSRMGGEMGYITADNRNLFLACTDNNLAYKPINICISAGM